MTFSERLYRIFIIDDRYKLIIGGLGNTLLISFLLVFLVY